MTKQLEIIVAFIIGIVQNTSYPCFQESGRERSSSVENHQAEGSAIDIGGQQGNCPAGYSCNGSLEPDADALADRVRATEGDSMLVASTLTEFAKDAGGRDNITVVVTDPHAQTHESAMMGSADATRRADG